MASEVDDDLPRVIAIGAQLRIALPIAEQCKDRTIAHLLHLAKEACDRFVEEQLPIPEINPSEIAALERRLAIYVNNTGRSRDREE